MILRNIVIRPSSLQEATFVKLKIHMFIESTLNFSETGYVWRVTLNAVGNYTGRIVPCVRLTVKRSVGHSWRDSKTPGLCCNGVPALNNSAESFVRKLVANNAAKIVDCIQGVLGDPVLSHKIAQDAFLDAFREMSPIVDSARFCSRWSELASLLQTRELIARELRYFRSAAVYLTNEQDADDLAQTAALKALENASTLKDPGKIRAWLRTILRNALFDAVRLAKRGPVAVKYDDETMSGKIDPESGSTEILEWLKIHTKQLPERDRAMIWDYVFGDRKMSEIAAVQGVHRANIMRALDRLWAPLKKQFTKDWQ